MRKIVPVKIYRSTERERKREVNMLVCVLLQFFQLGVKNAQNVTAKKNA